MKLKLDEMNDLVSRKNYKAAMEIADNIEWRRVRNVRTLCTVGEIYAANKRYEESRNIFLMAYHKSPMGKTILYRLIEVSIKMENLDEALEYYTDFVDIAPKDSTRYVLKYKLLSARNAPIEEQIETLEEYREKEFTERWAYELAKLYYEAGMNEKCIEICDDMTIWFHDGKYVIKALELKINLASLTPTQQRVYDEYMNPSFYAGIEESAAAEEKEEELKESEIIQEPEIKKEEPQKDKPEIIEEPEESTEEPEVIEEPKESTEEPEFIEEPEKSTEEPEESTEESEVIQKLKEIEEEDSSIVNDEYLQQKVAQGIKDILKGRDITEEPDIPMLTIPKVNLNEKARVEDLPVSEEFSLNLEDTILAAAIEQGIDIKEEKQEEVPVLEDADDSEAEYEEEPLEFSEEEELIRFIDEKNKDPEIEENDIIPRENKLDEEEEKMFKYFSAVPGMKEQLAEVLKDTQLAAADKTSNSGNIIIMGNRGSGKSSLSDFIMKAICRQLNMPAAKIAKVNAEDINNKDIPKIISKLAAGFLLIRNANQLNPDTVNALNTAMEFRTDGLTVILEDEKIGMRKFIARNPKFINKFTSTISIPVFTNDELVNFAKVYTAENGYRIDEMGILALYSLISDNQKEDEPMTVNAVKILVDNAIAKAESSTRKMKRNISNTRTDKDGFVILYEKDFK